MQSTEQTDFFELIDQLCASFDRPPARDEMRQAYWKALRDVRLSEVRANVDRIIRTATGATKFPRPGELRNETVSERSASTEAVFRDAQLRSERTWRDWFETDPELATIEHGVARVGRILAVDHQGSPQYAEALREDRRLRDQQRSLLERRARVVV